MLLCSTQRGPKGRDCVGIGNRVRKFLKIDPLRSIFRPRFFSNLCSLNKLEWGGLKGGGAKKGGGRSLAHPLTVFAGHRVVSPLNSSYDDGIQSLEKFQGRVKTYPPNENISVPTDYIIGVLNSKRIVPMIVYLGSIRGSTSQFPNLRFFCSECVHNKDCKLYCLVHNNKGLTICIVYALRVFKEVSSRFFPLGPFYLIFSKKSSLYAFLHNPYTYSMSAPP